MDMLDRMIYAWCLLALMSDLSNRVLGTKKRGNSSFQEFSLGPKILNYDFPVHRSSLYYSTSSVHVQISIVLVKSEYNPLQYHNVLSTSIYNVTQK